jgi:phosphatidate phosphatase APP1
VESIPFLVLFTEIHKLPKAVLLLKDIKTSLLNFYGLEEEAIIISLKNKTYFRILSQFKVCLIGDDSQHDPFLYEAISKIFP